MEKQNAQQKNNEKTRESHMRQKENRSEFLGGKHDERKDAQNAKTVVSGKNKYASFPKRYLALLLFVSIVLLAVYGGEWRLVQNKYERASELVNQLSREASAEREFRELQKTLSSTETEQKQLQLYFVDPDGVAPFLERIETLADHAGVLLSFESVNVPDEEKSALGFHFLVDGSFNDIYYFLSLFEALPFAVSFERMSLNEQTPRTPQEKDDSLTWEGDFSIVLHSFVK